MYWFMFRHKKKSVLEPYFQKKYSAFTKQNDEM